MKRLFDFRKRTACAKPECLWSSARPVVDVCSCTVVDWHQFLLDLEILIDGSVTLLDVSMLKKSV